MDNNLYDFGELVLPLITLLSLILSSYVFSLYLQLWFLLSLDFPLRKELGLGLKDIH